MGGAETDSVPGACPLTTSEVRSTGAPPGFVDGSGVNARPLSRASAAQQNRKGMVDGAGNSRCEACECCGVHGWHVDTGCWRFGTGCVVAHHKRAGRHPSTEAGMWSKGAPRPPRAAESPQPCCAVCRACGQGREGPTQRPGMMGTGSATWVPPGVEPCDAVCAMGQFMGHFTVCSFRCWASHPGVSLVSREHAPPASPWNASFTGHDTHDIRLPGHLEAGTFGIRYRLDPECMRWLGAGARRGLSRRQTAVHSAGW